jgi:hypothetical protein
MHCAYKRLSTTYLIANKPLYTAILATLSLTQTFSALIQLTKSCLCMLKVYMKGFNIIIFGENFGICQEKICRYLGNSQTTCSSV